MGTNVHTTMNGMTPGLAVNGGVYVVARTVVNPAEDYGMNGYFESHVSGTLAGHTYGGGFWVNVDKGFVDLAGGYFVCAQDNGIYEEAATTFSNSIYIYGMRAEFVSTSTPSAGVHMFSSNTSNRAITSLFIAADAGPSIGYTAGGGLSPEASVAGTIRFASLSNGNVLYLHAFSTST